MANDSAVSAILPAGPRRAAITAALLTGTFLSAIEVTVVATAMPTIVAKIGGLALFPWVYSAYLLAQTLTIPLYGRLADLFGRRITYVGGISIFLVGAILCGLAPSMKLLVAARAIQGLGAGAVLPLTMTIFGDLYEVQKRTKMQGWFSMVWGVASVAGPLTGGAIVLHWDWPWIFWLNLPFGLASIILVGALLPRSAIRREHRLDTIGALTFAGATLSLLIALLPAEQRPLDISPLFWLLGAAVMAAIFVRQERRHPEPLVPLDLFRERVHQAANSAGVMLGVALLGLTSYVPLYVQAVLGGSPVSAGVVLIPLTISWTGATIVSGRIVHRVGFQVLVRVGCGMVASGAIAGAASVTLGFHPLGIVGLLFYGAGMGATVSSFTVSVQECVAPKQKGIATALTQFSRSIGGAVGVAAMGAVLAAHVGANLSEADLHHLDPALRAAMAAGLQTIFWLMAAAALLAAIFGIGLYPRIETGVPPRAPPPPREPEPQ